MDLQLLARYRTEGDAGLVARSRGPRTSPTQVAAEVDERIVELRNQLSEKGLDAGPANDPLAPQPPERPGPVGQHDLADPATMLARIYPKVNV